MVRSWELKKIKYYSYYTKLIFPQFINLKNRAMMQKLNFFQKFVADFAL